MFLDICLLTEFQASQIYNVIKKYVLNNYDFKSPLYAEKSKTV